MSTLPAASSFSGSADSEGTRLHVEPDRAEVAVAIAA